MRNKKSRATETLIDPDGGEHAFSGPVAPEVEQAPEASGARPDALDSMISEAVTGTPIAGTAGDPDAASRALDAAFEFSITDDVGGAGGLNPEPVHRGRGRPRDPNSRRSRAAARRDGRDVPASVPGGGAPASMTRDMLYQRNLTLENEARARDAELAALRASASAASVEKLATSLAFTGRMIYGAIAQARGQHWFLSPEEQAQFGESGAEALAPYAAVIAEYVPAFNFLAVNYAIISSRIAWENAGRPTGERVADVERPAGGGLSQEESSAVREPARGNNGSPF